MALGRRKREAEPFAKGGPNAIVAAASRLNASSGAFGVSRIPKQSWQNEVWRQAEISGELKFASTWMANSISRCRLIVADVDANGKVIGETTVQRVLDIVKGLIGNPGQVSQMLGTLSRNLFLVGDCYVVAEPGPDGTFATWRTYSIDEISNIGANQVLIDTGDGVPRRLSTESNLVIRIYRPHVRRSWEADSPVRSALPTLREIEEYGRYINSVVSSRLAGAGIMGVPSEMNFPTPPEGLQPGETAFVSHLTKAMLTPIADLSDPSAVVPIVIEAPAAALERIVWIVNPQGELTSVPADLRKDARGALAVALDLPADVVTGTTDANHWGQWALEEQAIKIHIEPLMLLICSSLTDGFLHPALVADGIDPQAFSFWFDSSDLVLRPDRGQDAKDNYDRGEINGDALRTETGFTELDAPVGEEKALRDILKLVSLSPTAADALLPAIARLMGLERFGVDIARLEELVSPSSDPGGTPPQERAPDPNPSARDLPEQSTPDASPPVLRPGPAVVAGMEQTDLIFMAVRNALTRAGAMLSGRKAGLKETPKHEVHVALGGVSAEDAKRVLDGQFDLLKIMSGAHSANLAYDQAYELLTEGRTHA